MTEVEIYDTTQPADPATGKPPVKARIRQTHGEESRNRAQLEETASGTTEATEEAEQTYEGGTLDEVTVNGHKTAGSVGTHETGRGMGYGINDPGGSRVDILQNQKTQNDMSNETKEPIPVPTDAELAAAGPVAHSPEEAEKMLREDKAKAKKTKPKTPRPPRQARSRP